MLEFSLNGATDDTISSLLGCTYSPRHVPKYKAYSHTDLMTGLGVTQISDSLRCDL